MYHQQVCVFILIETIFRLKSLFWIWSSVKRTLPGPQWVNTLRPRQNGRHFADDVFKGIFFNENVWISIKISLMCVPRGPINNIPAMVQIMAWRRPGDKPLSETMVVNSPTHICFTRPQWVNSSPPSTPYIHQRTGLALVRVWCQAITWSNSGLLWISPFETNFSEIQIKIQNFSFIKMHLKKLSVKWCPFCPWGDELTNIYIQQEWVTSYYMNWFLTCPAVNTATNKIDI